ncbi:hypothetical protein GmHk_12G034776 [Glycine max]|nr:hypothetical protein GmHk_12G034776 [Glycine max]
MKGRRHKYGFNNNKREKAKKKRVVDDETGDKHQLDEVLRMPCTCGTPFDSPKVMDDALFLAWSWLKASEKGFNTLFNHWSTNLSESFGGTLVVLYLISSVPLIMGSPPASTPSPPPPPPPPSPPSPPPPSSDASASPSTMKQTHKAARLRSLSTRPPGAERPVVHADPAIGKANDPHRKKLRTYLGIVARDKVHITYENWKEVPTAQKDLIWEDIQAKFDIPEASDSRTKSSYCRPWGRHGGSLNQTSGGNGPLQPIRTVSRTLTVRNTASTRKSGPSFARLAETLLRRMCARRHRSSRSRILLPTFCLVEKLLAEKTKKELKEAAQSGSVDGVIDPLSPVRRHVNWKMARKKKTGEMTTEAAKEIVEKIDSFEEQATQGSCVPHGCQDVLPDAIGRPEHPGRVRAAGAGVTIKQYFGSAPWTSRSASSLPPDELQQLTQQIKDQPEESITEKVTRQVMASFNHMHSQLQSQMQSQGLAVPPEPLVGPSGPRVSIKGSCVDPSGNDPETGDSDRCGLYIEADPARLVAMGRVYEGSIVVHNSPLLPGQVKVSVEEVADAPVPVPTDEVSLVGQALHTFLAWPTHLVKSLSQQVVASPAKPPPKPDPEVRWDATVFGVFNPDLPLYIKHEDLSKIAHGVVDSHLTETCMRVGNSDIFGFLEPQSIQRSQQSQFESESYIKSWMQSSQHDAYLGAYLNGKHWQMVVILPKEHLVVWFCSLHNRPDNYLKGIINSALKGLDDAPQPKSKASARWIIVKYFNDPIPLEPERLKALRIQWAQFYLRVRDQV